jgi:long-subunit fatty acid transport protein
MPAATRLHPGADAPRLSVLDSLGRGFYCTPIMTGIQRFLIPERVKGLPMLKLRQVAVPRVFCAFAVLTCVAASAQLEFSVSPTPVGSGARAAGMADAFLSIADDATAASWNPAGLVQLQRPEISVVGSYIGVSEKFRSSDLPDLNSDHFSDVLELNFLSAVYPVPYSLGSSNISLSLSYQRKYDFSRNFGVQLNSMSDIGGTPVNTITDINFDQTGGFATISPSVAMEITESLSVGASFNIWRSSFLSENGWEKVVDSRAETTIGEGEPQITTQTTREEYSDFEAENYTVGLLWKATPKLSLGFRYDTGFRGDVGFHGQLIRNGMQLADVREDREIRVPQSISWGASYRFNDRLTMALDMSRTDWDNFYIKRASGERFSLVDGFNIDDPATATDFDPTMTVRFGAEYVLIPKTTTAELNRLWSLRGGLFFDQEPASGRSVAAGRPIGDGRPDNFYGFAVGVGLLAFQRFNFDVAYQFRYGNDVNSDFISGVESFSEDVIQHRLLLSTVIYF